MRALLVSGLFAAGPFAAGAEGPEAARVAELREVIGQWVATEGTISEEAAQWGAEKGQMGQLLELYREELALLDEELAEAGRSATEFDEEQVRLERETAAFHEARGEVRTALREARDLLVPLCSHFPTPLRDEIAEQLSVLTEWEAGEGEMRPALEALLTVLDRANRFARSITHAREVRDGREVDVIYAGLSHAYYLSADGGAGLVTLTSSGWQWEERRELHSKVADVLKQLEEQNPPRLVRLPVPAPREVANP